LEITVSFLAIHKLEDHLCTPILQGAEVTDDIDYLTKIQVIDPMIVLWRIVVVRLNIFIPICPFLLWLQEGN
jgi:hypothetical protein